MKAADKLSAYIKCVEERKAGNEEFRSAELQKEILDNLDMPEVRYFMDNLCRHSAYTGRTGLWT